ncbi:MAG TPA: membrane dipeptidase [Myxococcota bacterium]|nr:membrane dipeptidase [Myxococcota bacterium]
MISEEARAIHEQALIIDLHCDVLLTTTFLAWNWAREHRPNLLPGAALMGHVDLPRLRAGNVGCLALGVVVSPLAGRRGPTKIERMLDRMHAKLAAHPDDLELATTSATIRASCEAGRIACFAGLEGAHGLVGSLGKLSHYRDRGMRYVGFAHFSENEACKPMVGWGQDPKAGLTDYGRDLVDELNRLQMVIDVAHLNRAGLLELCERTRAPVIASHTACNSVHHSPRGLDDSQLRAIADTGGVIGVIFVTPFIGPGGLAAVVDHLTHIRDVVGVEHCAIGSDWEGWSLYPRDLDGADKLPLLTQALLERGWTAPEILACWGGNFLRVLTEVAG